MEKRVRVRIVVEGEMRIEGIEEMGERQELPGYVAADDYWAGAELSSTNGDGDGRSRPGESLSAAIWRKLPTGAPFLAKDVWAALEASKERKPASRDAFNSMLSGWTNGGKLRRLDVGRYERV